MLFQITEILGYHGISPLIQAKSGL